MKSKTNPNIFYDRTKEHNPDAVYLGTAGGGKKTITRQKNGLEIIRRIRQQIKQKKGEFVYETSCS